MRAISLWQPWASLMALGAKTIETRSWATPYRGPLVICASKKWNAELCLLCSQPAFSIELRDVDAKGLCGYALCVVELYDMRPLYRIDEVAVVGDHPVKYVSSHPNEDQFGDYNAGRWGWMTRNLRRLRNTVPVKGSQGLFRLDDATLAAVLKEVE